MSEAQVDIHDGDKVVRVIGLVLHLAIGVFPFAASGLLAPLYGIVLIYAVWAVGLVLIKRWWSRMPRPIILVPLAALLFWFVLMFAGDSLLGWTA